MRYREFVLSPYGVIKIKSLGYIVLGEMQRMLEESTQQHYGVMTHALEKWQQANVSQFLQRH
ncbi:hypothetical protein [Symbiopectobacterium purcellii]|uniref:hypothetical protein n=1 Tax=Symbiopectobacterium purcellii TaxID=2871826 RepID=UPI003F84BEFF